MESQGTAQQLWNLVAPRPVEHRTPQVDPATGRLLLDALPDVALPSPMPFIATRHYRSPLVNADGRAVPSPIGLLGPGWSLAQEMSLCQSDTQLTLRDGRGGSYTLPALEPGEVHCGSAHQPWIVRGGLDDLETHSHHHAAPLRAAWRSLHPQDRRRDNCFFVSPHALGPWWIFGSLSDGPFVASQSVPLRVMCDRFGRLLRLGHDPHTGFLSVVEDGSGRQFQLELKYFSQVAGKAREGVAADSGWRLVAIHIMRDEHVGEVHPLKPRELPLVRYAYTPRGELAGIHDRTDALTERFTYHPQLRGQIIAHARSGRAETHFHWNPTGQVIGQSTDGALAWQFDYTVDTTTRLDSLGRTHVWHFEGDGTRRRIASVERADGSRIHYQPREGEQPGTFSDALGRVTTEANDPHTQGLLSRTLADGQNWHYWHCPSGQITRIDDPNGAATRAAYDTLGRVVSITNAMRETTRLRYASDNCDLPGLIEDARGTRQLLEWTPYGQLARHTDGTGQTTCFHYDRWGQLVLIEGPEGLSVRNSWDSLGRLCAQTRAPHHTVQWQYNTAGDVICFIDANEQRTHFERNAHGAITMRRQGETTQHRAYDAAGRLVQFINENEVTQHFAYDVMDRLIERTHLCGRSELFHYNAVGELIESDDGGVVTQWQRDACGRITERRAMGGTQNANALAAQIATFAYDAAGRLIHAQHAATLDAASVRLAWQRDLLGRIVEETQGIHSPHGRTLWLHRVTHRYDARGQRAMTQIHGLPPALWHFSPTGQPLSLTLERKNMLEFHRDDLHRECTRRFAGLHIHTSHDALSRIERQQTNEAPPTDPEATESAVSRAIRSLYQYDANDHLTLIESAQGLHRRAYDAHGRLAHYLQPALQEQSRRYDAAGNLLQGTLAPRNWPHNRVRSNGDVKCEYDRWGRMTSLRHSDRKEQQHFSWDSQHRLIRFRKEDGDGVLAASYFYDPLGRRVARQTLRTDRRSGKPLGPISTTFYGWDGDHAVLSDHNGRCRIATISAPGDRTPLLRVEHAPATARGGDAADLEPPATGLLALDHIQPCCAPLDLSADAAPPVESLRVHLFHCDPHGTPSALISTKGELEWMAESDPDGVLLLQHNPEELTQTLRLAGHSHDEESDLHYHRHGYFAPALGHDIGLPTGACAPQHAWEAPLPNPVADAAAELLQSLANPHVPCPVPAMVALGTSAHALTPLQELGVTGSMVQRACAPKVAQPWGAHFAPTDAQLPQAQHPQAQRLEAPQTADQSP